MYLKSLEVHGFKSFANKMLFEFHNGITAIVGPNGSGKSNVADAVRWVLGEQSAKQLRGAKMEDVIFAGTQLRKPLGYAYVAITINNQDHKLSVPYEEVKIARRVYRSGESEYLLNGASCRLRDIQEILLDTGIGKEGYSIIGQGQIDKILSGKPEERRELFDEAAGIVKYKKRKAAAEKNLEEERQNLVRIEDILSELEKQVEPLALQSQKAKEFLGYRDELKNLDINVFLTEYDQIHKEIDQIEEKGKIATKDLLEAQAEYEKVKEEYVSAEKALEEKNRELDQNKEILTSHKMALQQAESDIKVLMEQIRTVHQNKEHSQEMVASIHGRMETAKLEKEKFEQEKQLVEKEIQTLEEKQSKQEGEQEKISQKMEELQEKIELCNQARLESFHAATDVKSKQERMETLLEQNNLKKAEITKKILENKTRESVITENLEQEEKNLLDISDKLTAIEDAIAAFEENQKQIMQEREQLEGEYRQIQQKYHMDHSRLASLHNLTERYEGFGQSIRRVMEQKKNYPGIVGVVADIIRVQKEYELAVETALGGSIQNIVTDNEQTAKAMIAHLKKNRYGRATFLPLTNMKAKPVNLSGQIMSEPGVIGMASQLVEAQECYSNLVQYLLGRFVVVDHIDHGIALAKKYHHTIRIVTTEGDLLNPGGSMSGGAFKNNNNLLGRRREMEDLEKRVELFKEQLENLGEKRKKLEESHGELNRKIEGNKKTSQELKLRQNTAKINYDRAKEDLEKNKESLEFIRLEQSQMEQKKDSLYQDIEQIKEQIQNNENQNKEREQQLEEWNLALEKAKEAWEEANKEKEQIRLLVTTKNQSVQFAKENIHRMEEDLAGLSQELQQARENGKDADEQVAQKEKQVSLTKEHMQERKEHMEQLEETIRLEAKKREEITKVQKDFFEKREELAARKGDLDKECFRLNSQKEKLEEKMDSYTNYMWEQYELTYHKAEEVRIPLTEPLGKMKEKIGQLKGKIKTLGDVNVNAIEQYQEVQERYELLNGQHDDLIEAANVLVGIIEELDVEMRKQFEEQFAQIKERFDAVFKELFGGGRGTITLTDDEDVLLAGIRIVAQPPGKKLQNMMQLSGGEKALTAIALLFAIQSLKPSPFCLLDEIEAALDDSNVDRYAQYLHKLTKDTQFIVITHRRGTMNAADILYGITMQEKGVSTLVSVNLLDEKEIAN